MQISPGQSQLFQGRRAKRGQQHIGAGQELMQLGLAFLGFQVGLHHLHPLVKLIVGMWGIKSHGVSGRLLGHALGWKRLEFAALGPHVCQAHHGGRAGQVKCHAQNANARQGLIGGWNAGFSLGHFFALYI